MPDYWFDQRLTPEHFQAIGELTAQWSFLEWQIEAAIWLLLPADESEGRIVTTRMNIRPKTEILALLARLKLPVPDRKGLSALMTKIVTAHDKRNKVIHGLWAKNSESEGYQLVWASGKQENRIKPEIIPMTKEDVREMVDEAVALNGSMNRLRLYLLARSMRGPQPSVSQG
jgi:hypothetical protein